GQEIKLTPDTLVIADAEQALAMAGIMGGKHSAVTPETQNILLESAFFDPVAIAGRARSYGLHTDSSHRFERGVDYSLQVEAMERATTLLLDIVGGQAGPLVQAQDPAHLPENRRVSLRRTRIVSGLSLEIADNEVETMLEGLGL